MILGRRARVAASLLPAFGACVRQPSISEFCPKGDGAGAHPDAAYDTLGEGGLGKGGNRAILIRMAVDALYLVRRSEPRSDLRDLDRVMMTAAVTTDDGDVIEAGRTGTVVGVWRGGAAYEVEFAQPMGALATVEAAGLQLFARAGT